MTFVHEFHLAIAAFKYWNALEHIDGDNDNDNELSDSDYKNDNHDEEANDDGLTKELTR